MAMGIVSDEDFLAELEKCSHKEIVRGRNGKVETPEVIREIVAEEVIKNGDDKEVAKQFGISTSSVSAYKNGATSTATYHEPNRELKDRNDAIRANIIGTARQKLFSALNHITDEKLKDAKVRDVAAIAREMSQVIQHHSPQVGGNGINAQFIFHVPQQKKESDFEVIEVTQ